jgi:hypothetical protein
MGLFTACVKLHTVLLSVFCMWNWSSSLVYRVSIKCIWCLAHNTVNCTITVIVWFHAFKKLPIQHSRIIFPTNSTQLFPNNCKQCTVGVDTVTFLTTVQCTVGADTVTFLTTVQCTVGADTVTFLTTANSVLLVLTLLHS